MEESACTFVGEGLEDMGKSSNPFTSSPQGFGAPLQFSSEMEGE